MCHFCQGLRKCFSDVPTLLTSFLVKGSTISLLGLLVRGQTHIHWQHLPWTRKGRHLCIMLYMQGLSRKTPAIANITRTVYTTSMPPGSQGEWTGMHVREQWWRHCTGQWGQQTQLSEHVYRVVVTFKITEWTEQRVCIKCCIKAWTFLHGNHLDDSEGHSYRWLVIGSFITTPHQLVHPVSCSFLVKHQITQVTQPPAVTSGFSQN